MMDVAITVEASGPIRPLSATKTDYRLLGVFFFLSFFELPIVWIGKDAIGLYDVYIWVVVLYLLFRTRGLTTRMPWAWRTYFIVFFAYLCYLSFELLYFVNFRSMAILFKFGETMLVMSMLYMFFTRFDLDIRRVIRLVEINLVLLCLFQLYSFVDTYHHIGPFPPGLGIGLWYRLSMPFMAGVSPNPAGFVAGVFILFNLFARNRGLIGRKMFLFVTFLLTLCLVATVDRTDMLAMIFVFVVYVFRRSFTKTRYIIAIGVFVVAVMFLVNYAVKTLPEDSPFWQFLKLVQNPSDFLKKVGSDESFGMRYKGAWPHELALWRMNVFTIFFGNGIAYVPIADGSYTGLLGNQGIIGLSFFFYIWYVHFLSTWKTKLPFLWILLLFVLVNGISFDTLVTSYRTVQAYLVCLFVILLAHGGLREQAWDLRTPRLYGVWRKVRWKPT